MSHINIRIPYRQLNTITQYQDLECGFEIVINLEDVDTFDIAYFNSFQLNQFTVHAPFFDITLGSKNKDVVNSSVKTLSAVFDICNEIRPKNVIMHHNYQPYPFAFDESGYVSRFCDSFQRVLKVRNDEYNVLFENVFEFSPSIGLKIIESLGEKQLGFCFDVGHFNLFSEISLTDWVNSWKEHILEYHLHNNFGKFDDHHSLGHGTVDMLSLCKHYLPETLTIENNSIEDSKLS